MRNRSLLLVLFAAACGDNLKGASNDASVDTPPQGPAGTISLVASSSTSETGTLVVTARRTDGSAGQVGATYSTANGTATEGADYTAASGQLTWADGDASDKVFTIALIDDLTLEGDETIELSLTNPTGGASIGETPAATITDDDAGGNAFVLTSNNRLLTFDRTTPGTLASELAVTGLPNPTTIVGIDFRPATGVLYALSSSAVLYTIDTTTGVATAGPTLTPNTTLSGTQFGVDFNPVADRLRVVSDTGQNLRINVVTGAVTTDTALTASIAPSGAAYTNNFAAACRTSLFTIEPATDRLLLQNPPNDGVLTAVGALGVDATAVRGFDTSTSTSGVTSAFAVLDVGGASRLFGINTTTGAAISAGTIPLTGIETIRGFALPPPDAATPVTQALGELIGVTTTTVLSYERGAPGKACTSAPLTGLANGDVPVDVDARPSTGEIHILTNNAGSGKVYTVNPTTGAATGAVTVTVPLTGTSFGMDFNPTGVVPLRIVSSSGQNVRVTDLATGAATSDGALNGATTVATGSAYTDSVQGAGTTTLYVLDPTTDQLLIQNPPNAGTTTVVGSFGVDITTLAGFDIDGRDNVAFLGNTSGGATTLHTINLATGAVSASLGTLGGGPLVGLTRRTPTTTVFGIAGGTNLVRIPLNDPTTVTVVGAITGLANNETILGLDFRSSTGVLYGVGSTSTLYRIDTTTAAATVESTLAPGLPAGELGVDFNPTGAVPLRIVSTGEDNLRVADITTGVVTADTPLSRAARTYYPNAIAYSSNIPGATTTTLYALDNVNNRLLAIVPPNAGGIREIGPLGSSPGVVAGFEIIGPDTAVAVFNAFTTRDFVTIDLVTGLATSVGNVGIVADIVGIAAAPSAVTPAADATITGVTAAGTLFSFPRNAPGTVTIIGAITNIGLLEAVEAFDIRPSDGVLYLLTRGTLTNTGHLYTVTGTVATLVGDLPAPLGALVDYSIDFNPTGTVPLRLIGSDGSNARIPALTGPSIAVTTDTSLNVAAPDVAGVAYTNNFRGATATSLFALDLATASIVQINTPNSGNLVMIGAMSATLVPNVNGAAAFDIAGGNNGLSFATLQVGAEAFSRLYRVNTSTGRATEIGTGVGVVAAQAIRGLAIDVR